MTFITFMQIAAGALLPFVLWSKYNRNKRDFKKALEESPIAAYQNVDETSLCTKKSKPHMWESLTLMDPFTGEQKTSNVCMTCGFINTLNKQFNPQALEKILKQRKMMNDFKIIYQQVLDEAWVQYSNNIEFLSDIPISNTDKLKMRDVFEAGIQSSDLIKKICHVRLSEKYEIQK